MAEINFNIGDKQEERYSVTDFAKKVGKSRQLIYTLLHKGKLKAFKDLKSGKVFLTMSAWWQYKQPQLVDYAENRKKKNELLAIQSEVN